MDYNVQSNIKKTVFSDIKEITNTNVDWNRFNGKTVLITGAGGFIGYYLVLTFLARNDFYDNNIKLLAFVRNRERAEKKFGVILERDDIELVVADVTNKIECERADFIIHAASQASNIQFETDPVGTINANLSGTSNILDFALESKSESVLVVSSLKVYGALHNGKNSISEDDIGYIDFTSYKNCYAVGKRASETLAASYCKQFGLNVKIADRAIFTVPAVLRMIVSGRSLLQMLFVTKIFFSKATVRLTVRSVMLQTRFLLSYTLCLTVKMLHRITFLMKNQIQQ